MGVGVPIVIGTALTAVAGTTNVFSMTTNTAIVAGDLVVVAVYINGNSLVTTASITDGKNTYSKVNNATSGNFDLSLWYTANATAVASGTVITATFNSSTVGANNFITIGGARVTQVGSNPLDVTAATANFPVGSVNVVGGTRANPFEIIMAASAISSGTYQQPTNFTNLYNVSIGNNSDLMDYDIVNGSTGSITYTPASSTTNVRVLGVYGSFLAINNSLFVVSWIH